MSRPKQPSCRSVSAAELAYYRAHFREALREVRREDDAVVCLECGALRKTLGTHVSRTHDLTLDEYRAKWGYNRQTRFAAQSTHEKMRQRALTENIGQYGSRVNLEKARAARAQPTESLRLENRLDRRKMPEALNTSEWQRYPDRKTEDSALGALVKDGYTRAAIAKRTGLTAQSVRRRLQAGSLIPPAIPRKKITNQQVLALRAVGLWSTEIAARLGSTRDAVAKRLWKLRRRGVYVPPERPRLGSRQQVSDDQLLELLHTGLGLSAIARQLGMHPTSVGKRIGNLRRRGLVPADSLHLKRRDITDEQVLALIQEGLSQREIAVRFNATNGLVKARLRRLQKRGILPAAIAAKSSLQKDSVIAKAISLRKRGLLG